MAGTTSFVQTSFLGGEISQSAQGRMDLPVYKTSMNACFNGLPIEAGAWVRRPGTQHVAPTRGGVVGRGIAFAFEESAPYTMQFTDGILRFTTGPALVMTNDQQAVVSISAANPAVITTALPHGWTSGNATAFNSLGVNNPLLQNRQVTITVTGSTTFSIADAITGAAIDGSTLGTFASGNVTRVLEIATTYTSGSWSTLRSVQAETRTVLLNGTIPQVLQVATLPGPTSFATFTLNQANFIDGPYLDPIAGSFVSSSALNGVVSLTFSFQAFDPTAAYNLGDFVTSAGVGYKSIASLNQGHTPPNASFWTPVNGGASVNEGLGWTSSDIGRLIRLFSEPALWNSASSYVVGNAVAYSDGDGGFTYWTATGTIATSGPPPGTSSLWALAPAGAAWTWGQVLTVSGVGLIPPTAAFGNFSSQNAAFDGNTTKPFATSAGFTLAVTTYPPWSATTWTPGNLCQYQGVGYQALLRIFPSTSTPGWNSSTGYSVGNGVQWNGILYIALLASGPPPAGLGPVQPPNATYWSVFGAVSQRPPPNADAGLWTSLGALQSPSFDIALGQHYTVATAIQSATFYPTTDVGIANVPAGALIQVNLRGKASTVPNTPSDGTLLGASGVIVNQFTPLAFTSANQTSTWNYVWFEVLASYPQPLLDSGSHVFTCQIGAAQAQFYSPNISNGSVITAQIRGPALLYNQTIRTWRAGLYSNTTGWPTCGTYHEGRIWLGGVISNRFDASVSNGLNGNELDFTPTGPSGVVSDNNAISYICTGEDSNQILWMTPDQQGVLFGTQAGEWLISAPSAGAISPTNIKAVRVTKIGCANIEPRRAEHTLIIVQKFGRKIVEYFADVFSGKFSAPNLSERAKHLTVGGIAEIAYQQELAPIIWMRRNDGALIGATYKRDTLTTSQGPNIIGHHRHALGSGRLVESICVGPSVDGNLDTLSMVTNDPSTGIRHIEVMTDLLDEGFPLNTCWFVDGGVVPSSTVIQPDTGGPYGSLVVNGLGMHNGKTVSAWLAGLDCGDYTVASGSITIPFGDGVSGGTGAGLFTAALVQSFGTSLPGVVGFAYHSDGQLVRPVSPSDTGTQAGPGFAKLGRQHYAAAQLYGVVNGSIQFGTDFNATLDTAKLQVYADGPGLTVQQQYSGIWRDTVNSAIDFDGMISWRIARPYPAFVIAVGGFDARADA